MISTMTWNPLKKSNLSCRPTAVSPAISKSDDRQLEQIFITLQSVEETTKKLQKEMKKYLDSASNASKSEQKISSDLSASNLCHKNANLRKLVEDYHTVAFQVCESIQELTTVSQKTFLEPMKVYKNHFSIIDTAFQKREQYAQEWRNLATRLKKLEDRERTASNIIKLDKERKLLAASAEELADYHDVLVAELLQFLAKRSDYFAPTLQALICSQLEYHGNTTRLFTHLLPESSKAKGSPSSAMIPEDEYQESVQEKISKIKALSIVKQ